MQTESERKASRIQYMVIACGTADGLLGVNRVVFKKTGPHRIDQLMRKRCVRLRRYRSSPMTIGDAMND